MDRMQCHVHDISLPRYSGPVLSKSSITLPGVEMPLIRISHAAQYDPQVKEAVMRDVTRVYSEATGCDPLKVWVLIEEIDKSDWSTGGVPLSERASQQAKALSEAR